VDSNQKAKIKAFMSDKVMNKAVKSVMLDAFMKAKDGDIHMKAAQMVAINLLEDAFKELNKFASQQEKLEKDVEENIGL